MSIDPQERLNILGNKIMDLIDKFPQHQDEIDQSLRLILANLQKDDMDDTFEPEKSRAWEEIERHFGSDFSHEELINFAIYLSKSIDVPINRKALQTKVLIVEWIDNNINECLPFFSSYV